MMCTKPDRDEPRMVCGYPVPCPHHTVILSTASEKHDPNPTIMVSATKPLSKKTERLLHEVAAAALALDGTKSPAKKKGRAKK